jgi:hypothetical protein
VRNGDVPVAIVIPKGIGESFGQLGFSSSGPAIQMLADPSDPIAPQMVQGLLQKVVMTAAPDLVMQGGMKQFEKHAGALTPEQRKAVDEWIPTLKADAGGTTGGGGAGGSGGMGIAVTVVDVMRNDDRKGSLISFYAAGIGVMFLLFSSVGGAGGALLEEAESGTLERLLSTNIGMTGVLIGKWLFLSLIGFAQLTVMFLWGRVAFGLPLFSHIPGFVVMTVVTAGCRRGVGPGAREPGENAGPVVRLLDDPDPDHVGARRKHVPSLPDERDNAEDGAADVQRLGARRISEGVLEKRRGVGAVAAGARALRARRDVPRNRAAAQPSLGARVIGWRGALAVALAASAMALSAGGCKNIDVRTEAYATLAEAQAAGAVDRGWLPRGLPPGTPRASRGARTATRIAAGACSIFRPSRETRCAPWSAPRFRSMASSAIHPGASNGGRSCCGNAWTASGSKPPACAATPQKTVISSSPSTGNRDAPTIGFGSRRIANLESLVSNHRLAIQPPFGIADQGFGIGIGIATSDSRLAIRD